MGHLGVNLASFVQLFWRSKLSCISYMLRNILHINFCCNYEHLNTLRKPWPLLSTDLFSCLSTGEQFHPPYWITSSSLIHRLKGGHETLVKPMFLNRCFRRRLPYLYRKASWQVSCCECSIV